MLNIALEEGAFMPEKAHPGDAGYDLRSPEDHYLRYGDVVSIDTGVSFEIPEGLFGDIRPRSGLMFRNHVIAGIGTIDSNYRGTVKVYLENNDSNDALIIKRGMKIAQIVFTPYADVEFNVVDKLEESDRGSNGFGSTGLY